MQVHPEPPARFPPGESSQAGDHGPRLSAPEPSAAAERDPAAAPLSPSFSHHRRGNNTGCLLVGGKLFANVWEGSEWSCNYINPEHELKIQKLLMCLFFVARDEAQLPTDTRARVPQLAPKLLFSSSW